jgi:hypothetical protein
MKSAVPARPTVARMKPTQSGLMAEPTLPPTEKMESPAPRLGPLCVAASTAAGGW